MPIFHRQPPCYDLAERKSCDRTSGKCQKTEQTDQWLCGFARKQRPVDALQLANNPAPTGSAITGVALESPAAANRVRKSELKLQGWLVWQDSTVERLKAIAGQGIDSQADKACSRCTAWKPYEKQATCPSAAEANLQSFPDPYVFDGLLLSGWAGHCR